MTNKGLHISLMGRRLKGDQAPIEVVLNCFDRSLEKPTLRTILVDSGQNSGRVFPHYLGHIGAASRRFARQTSWKQHDLILRGQWQPPQSTGSGNVQSPSHQRDALQSVQPQTAPGSYAVDQHITNERTVSLDWNKELDSRSDATKSSKDYSPSLRSKRFRHLRSLFGILSCRPRD